jgi:sigma-B regulation protein RsbU (phosphoserine phosphatase)
VRQRSILPGTLVEIVSDVNQQMVRDFGETGGFMTLFYLTIDTKNKCLHWIRAGHDPAIFYDPQTDTFEELRGDGIALGVDMHGHYAQYQKTNLKKGQIVLLGSDGLWEARNPAGEMFGKEPICEITRKLAQASAREILTSCFHGFNVFLGDRAPEDDVTLVVIKISED